MLLCLFGTRAGVDLIAEFPHLLLSSVGPYARPQCMSCHWGFSYTIALGPEYALYPPKTDESGGCVEAISDRIRVQVLSLGDTKRAILYPNATARFDTALPTRLSSRTISDMAMRITRSAGKQILTKAFCEKKICRIRLVL